MEIYNIAYNLYVQDGEHEPKQMTNFTPVIETAYYPLESSQDDIPAYLGIQLILEDGSVRSLTLPMIWHAQLSPKSRALCSSRPVMHLSSRSTSSTSFPKLGAPVSASAAFTCRATAPTGWRMVSMSPCGTDVSQVRPSSRFRI